MDGQRALNAPFSWPAGLKRCLSPGHKPANSEPKSGAETRLAGGRKEEEEEEEEEDEKEEEEEERCSTSLPGGNQVDGLPPALSTVCLVS